MVETAIAKTISMSKISRNILVGGMDLDVSPEIIDNKAYREAHNVIFNSVGTDGSLHNMRGSENKSVSGIMNWRDGGINKAGDWVCQGMFTNTTEDKIFLFMYATTTAPFSPPDYVDRNILLQYDILNDNWKVVLAGIDEDIQWSDNVLDADVVDFREQEFLFWVNYDEVPYKIEISESIKFIKKIGEGDPYDLADFTALVSVIQIPPLFPPEIEYITDPNLDQNNLITGIYSFKYRYIYQNGGVSAFSPVSKIQYDFIISNGADTSEAITYKLSLIHI